MLFRNVFTVFARFAFTVDVLEIAPVRRSTIAIGPEINQTR